MKQKKLSLFSFNNFFWILVIILVLPLTLFLISQNTDNRQKAAEDVLVYVIPDQIQVQANQQLKINVSVSPLTSPVKSVFLSLTYPQEKFDIVSVSNTDSPFTETLEQLTSQGLIRIGQTASFPVTEPTQFVTITFQSKEAVMASEIKGALDSYAVDLNDQRLSTTVTLDATAQPQVSQETGLSVESVITLVTSLFNQNR
jgi:hypothetical protein